jgi:hypothetical protein
MRFRIYFNHNLENNNRLKFIHSAARCSQQREEKAKSRFSRQQIFSFPIQLHAIYERDLQKGGERSSKRHTNLC